MINDPVCSEDYIKILQFIESMRVAEDNFSAQVLSLLANIFGYTKCDFWLHNGNDNIICSATTIGDNFINEYLKYYTKFDVLHPQNIDINDAIKRQVMYFNNVISPNYYDNMDYCKFLIKYGLAREMAVYLSNNNKLIGSIAIGRSQDEKDFSSKEVTTIKLLAKCISQGLYSHQLYMENKYEKKIFESFVDESENGMIICDHNFNICYCNQASKDICHELLGNERCVNNPMKYFVETVLTECGLFWKIGYHNTFYTSSLKRVKINVLPTVMGGCGINCKSRFIILLSYEDSMRKKIYFNQNPAQKLTIREGQILNLIIQGKTNQEISQELYISIHTVKKYIRILFDKFNVKNRASLIYLVTTSYQ